MSWNFKRTEKKPETVQEGKHRVMIKSAEMAVSKKGNDMMVVKLAISGHNLSIWHYITFMNDKPEITNRMLTQFFDSFGIEDGNFDLNSYQGKAGAAMLYNDEDGYPKVKYFIHKNKQGDLPDWKGAKVAPSGFVEVKEDDCPYF